MDALRFHAELEDVPGVGAYVAVRADQDLTALHDVVRTAFGWYDDHLYSFWLDGRFWGDRNSEYTRPDGLDELGDSVRTADVALGSLDLTVGQRIAYVFDFGDEWRVRLTLEAIGAADGDAYPRIIERVGEAPPQYPDVED